MSFNWSMPYPSQRMPIVADNMVATSQPLATAAGLEILRQGGNAVDAAIATAATLTVVEPTSNGLGSDAFALIWDGTTLQGINGSGRSPKAWNYDLFANRNALSKFGWESVTVPGAVSVWVELAQRFGSIPLEKLLESAIHYAEHGFPVSPMTADSWRNAEESYGHMPHFRATFLPQGHAPKAGDRFSNYDQAETLRQIATTQGESFYRGPLAKAIVECARAEGGLLSNDDLAQHKNEWVKPLSLSYGDIVVHELPPNGQGIATLIALGILRHTSLSKMTVDSSDSLHLQIEAMKLAFHLVQTHIADPAYMRIAVEGLLDGERLRDLANRIDLNTASTAEEYLPHGHGTVYLTTADASGKMVSFIQSNYMGFGSGVVIPNTGISMQNRACGFTLERGHPNQIDGSKRPFHTIIPGFVTRDGKPLMSFGVMGGRMQSQGHVQMIVRIFDYKQNPQAASDAPRWCILDDFSIALERGFKAEVIESLQQRGHRIVLDKPQTTFGGAQIIFRQEDHYVAASDHRKDGLAMGF